MDKKIINKIGEMDCNMQLLETLFPQKVGNYTRIVLSPMNLAEEIKAFKERHADTDWNVYENIRDIVIYVSDDMKTMKGILLEHWKNYGFIFSVCNLDAHYSEEIKSIDDLLSTQSKDAWNYHDGIDGDETYNFFNASDSLIDLLS